MRYKMANQYKVIFILPTGEQKEIMADEGDNLLEVAHHNHINLEGACESALACSTCHVIVKDGWFNKLDEASEKEEDLLDYAFGLTSTSRLGCQIIVGPETDGIIVEVPRATRNMMVS